LAQICLSFLSFFFWIHFDFDYKVSKSEMK